MLHPRVDAVHRLLCKMKTAFAGFVLLALSACASPPVDENHPYQEYLLRKNLEMPSPDSFDHCRAYGCQARDRISLNKKEWSAVRQCFRGVKNPASERMAMSRAVGLLEREIGPKTGTSGDLGGTFRQTGPYQLDCVDESTNTTTYLAMMQNDKLLKYHSLQSPTYRTPMTTAGNGKYWPHFTAVVTEKKTNMAWAVDSWARDNGYRADIMPLDQWVRGEGPGESSDPKPKD